MSWTPSTDPVLGDKRRIEQAKEDWKMGRFTPVPGETEFIPLSET
jgi:hypothetical protein